MKIYKLEIKLNSSHITPWQSDTIFGSLCWLMAQKEGKEKLRCFLEQYKKGLYPFVVSEGFPGDLLPKPMAGNAFVASDNITKKEALEVSQKAKVAKKNKYISLEEFNTIINNKQVEIKPKEKTYLEAGVMHNQISRMTNTTSEGSLFEATETFWDSHISIYFGVEEGWKQIIVDLFELLALKGYGKRISVGKGHFKIVNMTEFKKFLVPKNANSFVVLSNYIPKCDDPVVGQYKTFVKHGKLGQDFALEGNPFKKPFLMIKPGAVFWSDNPQSAYGRLVEDVSPKYPQVVQCGCTLAIPAFIDKPETL